jgi:hypothetical protein
VDLEALREEGPPAVRAGRELLRGRPLRRRLKLLELVRAPVWFPLRLMHRFHFELTYVVLHLWVAR